MVLVRVIFPTLLLPLVALMFAIAWLSEAIGDIRARGGPALRAIRAGAQPLGVGTTASTNEDASCVAA
jgi:hypothetical protein